MQVVQPTIVTDDFIPLYIIEAARFEKGLFGSYKQSRDWVYGAIVHNNVVFNMDVIGQQPRKLLMTMLLYWRSSSQYHWATHIEIVTKAFRYFFDHYRDSCRFEIVNGKFFADEAVATIILLLKFYPESEELSRLIKMILPAFIGATNVLDVGHIFNRRPFVFDASDEVRAMSMHELITKLEINEKLTDFLQRIITEHQRRVVRRDVVKLEREALQTFLRDFLGYDADDCQTVFVSLARSSGLLENKLSLKALYDMLKPWNEHDPSVYGRIPPVPTHLLLKTIEVLFVKPIIVNDVCSSCWIMQQPGAPQMLTCRIHQKAVQSVPSAPPVETAPTTTELPDCPLCLSCKIQVVIVPCGHFICGACSAHIKDCPLCRGSIDKFVKCYF